MLCFREEFQSKKRYYVQTVLKEFIKPEILKIYYAKFMNNSNPNNYYLNIDLKYYGANVNIFLAEQLNMDETDFRLCCLDFYIEIAFNNTYLIFASYFTPSVAFKTNCCIF